MERQWPQQHRIEHAEDRRIGADAQGEGKHDDDRETWPPPHLPQCKTRILKKYSHLQPPTRTSMLTRNSSIKSNSRTKRSNSQRPDNNLFMNP
jgi:hypothetical protein